MKNKRIYKRRTASKNIVLPIMTIGVVGMMFCMSSFHEPSWTFNWKTIRPEIRDTVKLIEDFGRITGGAIGIAGKTSQQFYRRRWLIRHASVKELKALMHYPDGAIIATAYEGLLRKPESNKFEIIRQALNDTTTFFIYQGGCVGYPMMLGEYLNDKVIPISNKMPPLTIDRRIKLKLSDENIKELQDLYSRLIAKKEKYLRAAYSQW